MLLGLKSGDAWQIPDDEIIFQSFPVPDTPDIAREIHRQRVRLTTGDKIGRMRRNIIAILHEIPNLKIIDGESFGSCVSKLRNRGSKRDREIAGLMHTFAKYRNQVEYEGFVIGEDESSWQTIKRAYDEIERWACESKYVRQEALERIDA